MKRAIATPPGKATRYVNMTPGEITARQVEEDAFAQAKEQYERLEKYKDDRRAEYPPIGDQLDAIWKALERINADGVLLPTETLDVLDKIVVVKNKYPEPEELKK